MQHDQFTVKSREVLMAAAQNANERGNPEIRPGHLLFALLDQDKSIVQNIIRNIGVDFGQLKREAEAVLKKYPQSTGGRSKANLSRQMDQVIENAKNIMGQLNDSLVSAEVLFLAVESIRGYAQQLI